MRRGAVLASLAALALCGCGRSSLSSAQLRQDATRICATARRQTDRIATPTSPAQSAQFLAQGAAALRPELKALAALRPPSDLARVYAAALSASSAELIALSATARHVDVGDDPVSAISSLAHRLGPMESRANAAWHSLAIPACVNR